MKIKTKKIYKKAFTLAEILVTLMILGVVFAALAPTVNTFNQERKQEEYAAKTGKVYSLISEALRAQFVATHERMVGNPAADNLVGYITDSTITGTIKIRDDKDGEGFRTHDGMVFAIRGDNCHQQACFVIVDMDGQNNGITRRSIDEMLGNFNVYKDASSEDAMDPDNGHSDIVVFMVKDGQIYPYTEYTAENMKMEMNQDADFQTSAINLQVIDLNISPD